METGKEAASGGTAAEWKAGPLWRLRCLLHALTVFVLMGVMGIAGAPVVLWRRRWTVWWMKLYIRWTLALSRLLCGIRTEVRGEVPTGAVVVAAKHQSLLDVLILFQVLPEPHFVMKRELVWAPVFGLYALRAGCIWIARDRRGQSEKMIRRLNRRWSGSGQIVIYPQGTRVPPGERRPYRRGAARLYEAFGLPMVLAATNAGWFWPRRGIIRRPGTAVVAFLETLPPGLAREALMARMEASVEAASERLGEEAARSLGLAPR